MLIALAIEIIFYLLKTSLIILNVSYLVEYIFSILFVASIFPIKTIEQFGA